MTTQNNTEKPDKGAASGREQRLVRIGFTKLFCCARCGAEARLTSDGHKAWGECADDGCDNCSDAGKTWDSAAKKWDKYQGEIVKAN